MDADNSRVLEQVRAEERERIRKELLTKRCRNPLVGAYIEWRAVAEVCGPQPAKREEETHGAK